jgi:hypothetical protein
MGDQYLFKQIPLSLGRVSDGAYIMSDEGDYRGSLKPLAEGIAIVVLAAAIIVALLFVQQIVFRDLVVFVVAMFAPLIAFAVVVSKMPDDNPFKDVLRALSYRIAATVAAAAVAIAIEPIVGIDAIYDILVPLALIWYWFTFFRDCSSLRPDHATRGRI